jgi:uncharacterized protein YjbI with pentapeptide repeats
VATLVTTALCAITGLDAGAAAAQSSTSTTTATAPPASAVTHASGRSVGKLLAGGTSINYSGTAVTSAVTLPAGTHVTGAFACTGCTFHGPVKVAGVTFQGPVNLSGSRIDGGKSSFVGSTFDAQAAFNGAHLGAADFSGATFTSPASWVDTSFTNGARFNVATFKSTADFAGTSASAAACRTGGPAVARDISFVSARFQQSAQFRERCFRGPATFGGASFDNGSDFSGSLFTGPAVFDGAQFGGTNLFSDVTFAAGASFNAASVDGSVSFDGADFGDTASLLHVTGLGMLSLVGAEVQRSLTLTDTQFPELIADVATIDRIQGVPAQIAALRALEDGANRAGKYGLAQDARYRRLQLQNAHDTGVTRLFDTVVLQDIGGYLSKPKNTGVALLLILLAGTILRALPRLWERIHEFARAARRAASPKSLLDRIKSTPNAIIQPLTMLASGAKDAISTFVSFRPDVSIDRPLGIRDNATALLQWGEFVAQKAVLAVIGVELLQRVGVSL